MGRLGGLVEVDQVVERENRCFPGCLGRPSYGRCRGTNTGAAAERAECVVRRRIAGKGVLTLSIELDRSEVLACERFDQHT